MLLPLILMLPSLDAYATLMIFRLLAAHITFTFMPPIHLITLPRTRCAACRAAVCHAFAMPPHADYYEARHAAFSLRCADARCCFDFSPSYVSRCYFAADYATLAAGADIITSLRRRRLMPLTLRRDRIAIFYTPPALRLTLSLCRPGDV